MAIERTTERVIGLATLAALIQQSQDPPLEIGAAINRAFSYCRMVEKALTEPRAVARAALDEPRWSPA